MKLPSRTVEQKTSPLLGFPKPGEFIEMTGTHMLEASGPGGVQPALPARP